GLLRVYGAGGLGFYADNGAGGYTSPAGDNGTLSKATGGGLTTYTYSRPDGSSQTFDGSRQLVRSASADGFAALTYSYSSGKLATVLAPDGARTTLSYSLMGGSLTGIQTGGRTVTPTLSGNLTALANPDGGLRSFSYDTSHRLTQDSFGVLSATYAYTSGALTGSTQGDGGPTSVSPYTLLGLSALAAGTLWTGVTDPLLRLTRAEVDTYGRPLRVLAPDGGVTLFGRDGNGRVTTLTDPLTQVTSYTRDSAGYVTQEALPDGNSRAN